MAMLPGLDVFCKDIRIPDDVAILGTGDTPQNCLTRDPTLSSIVIP